MLAAQGVKEREMAARLGLAVQTVRVYLARARCRLGARSTTQAVAIALWRGLITPQDYR